MLILHFTSQIILLGVGFGVGYWLLITAKTHEDRLKIIGETLGFVLIGLSIILALFNFFYSMKMASLDFQPQYYPINKQVESPATDNDEYGTDENLPTQEGKPIKSDIHDHD